ncbi:MAG: hypothetical protein ACJA13_001798 [Paraglaciecola sp.]|jgi:hypothetical protein
MPCGSDVIQRTDIKPAFSGHLLEPILQPANIFQAMDKQGKTLIMQIGRFTKVQCIRTVFSGR